MFIIEGAAETVSYMWTFFSYEFSFCIISDSFVCFDNMNIKHSFLLWDSKLFVYSPNITIKIDFSSVYGMSHNMIRHYQKKQQLCFVLFIAINESLNFKH